MESLNNNVIDIDLNEIENTKTQTIRDNLIQVKKNVVLYFLSDASGCGFIRGSQIMDYLYYVLGRNETLVPITMPIFTFEPTILARTRTIIFQRQMDVNSLEIIRHYRKLASDMKIKLIWEMDDFIWWEDKARKVHGVPSYNAGSISITESIKHSSIEIMKMMDLITVSTDFLAKYIRNDLGIKVPVKVVPNVVSQFYWGSKKKLPINKKIVKPKFIYTGSPTHYMNPNTRGLIQSKGDWNNAFCDWVNKSVIDNKIDFYCMGLAQNQIPYFFNDIKDKAHFLPWCPPHAYHLKVLESDVDFGLMPLVPNYFNYSKSDLKYIEYAIAGIVGIGTTFKNGFPSPYDNMPYSMNYNCSVQDIDDLVDYLCYPENYNKALESQYKDISENGRITESSKYINSILEHL